jgi:hypothetical protein
MLYKGTNIRSLSKLLAVTDKHPKVRFAFKATEAPPGTWARLGFSLHLEPGECIIPSCVGRVTSYNANGKEVVRKDLPKVIKSFESYRSWRDWHGREHTGSQWRDMEVYPRDYVAAPSEPLYASIIAGETYIVTREIDLADGSTDGALHLANMMLECFGEFQAIDVASGIGVGVKLKSLQWEVLPPGTSPWTKAKPFVERLTENLSESARELIRGRMGTIAGFKPDFLAMGRGGFSAYFVYGFESKGIFILESAHLDNATYVFRHDWETLSQLTKNEIISGKLAHDRVVHDHKWESRLGQVLKR